MAKKIMRKFTITEISAVDTPAQEGARAILMKRADPAQDLKKEHKMPKDLADQISELETKNAELAKKLADLETAKSADLAKAAEQAAEFEVLAKMSDAEKDALAKMADGDAKAFKDMTPEERKAKMAEMKKAAEVEDPVIYKSATGLEFFKSDDPRLVQMAKERDNEAKRAATLEKAAQNASFEKQAGDMLNHYPGDKTVHVAMVKALSGIEDQATRDAAFQALQSKNRADSEMFKALGARTAAGEPFSKSAAEDELDNKAKALAKSANITYLDAYAQVTRENPDLYEATTR